MSTIFLLKFLGKKKEDPDFVEPSKIIVTKYQVKLPPPAVEEEGSKSGSEDINLTNDNESGEQEEEEDYDVNWEYAPAQVSSRRRSIMLS